MSFIRARVEYRKDPLGLGRVKARVPGLHEDIPVMQLPWMRYVSMSGGGLDNGSFIVPEVGSWVLCDTERNTDKWFYLGVVRGIGSEDHRGSFVEEEGQLQGQWISSGEEEVPSESSCLGSDPVVNTIYKSIKGASINVSDSDEDEFIDIISHSGSTIRMINPKNPGTLTGRESARRDKNIESGMDTESNYGTCAIVIKDINGNIIRSMVNRDGKSTVEVISHHTGKVSGVELLPDDDKATVFVTDGTNRSEVEVTSTTIKHTNGKSSVFLTPTNINLNADNIVIKGSSIDMNGGTVNVKGEKTDIDGDTLNLTGNTTKVSGTSSVEVVGESTKVGGSSSVEVSSGGSAEFHGSEVKVAGTTKAVFYSPLEVEVGGLLAKIGPALQLGYLVPPVSPKSPGSPDSPTSPESKSPESVGSWSNNVDPKYGGDI